MDNGMDAANIGASLGRQLMGTINAKEDGYEKMAKLLSDVSLKQAQGDFYQQKANSERQRAQYQKPEFASKIAASLAGLSDSQAGEMDAFTKNGNWGMTPARDDPVQQMTLAPAPKVAPDWATPQVKERYNAGRTAQLLNLAGTGDSKADDLEKAIGGILSRGDYDSSKTSPDALLKYAQAQYAQKGGAPFSQDGTGVLNVLEGGFSAKPEWQAVQKSAAGENNAQAASAYASANNSNANARLHLAQIPEVQSRIELNRSKIGQTTTVIGPDGVPVEVTAKPAKPMPAAALKMQQEELDGIALAAGMNQQLGRFVDDIEGGKLKLGLVDNMVSRGKNFVGASDPNTRNFASFQATLEKLRNDSLRLNKGVQTEGDAVRAWNELVSNANDPEVVKQRLGEIQKLNDRAVAIKQMNVNQVRRNFGQPDIDTSGYTAPPAGAPASPPSRSPALASIPDAAIAHLKANPNLAGAFAAKYGKEATDAALGKVR